MDLLTFFHWALVVAKSRLDLACAYLDFEKPFMNAGKHQFPNALTLGCFLIGSK